MIQLGPIIAPCWTRERATGEVAVRLWTGYSWLEFGCEMPFEPSEIERLSEPLELNEIFVVLADNDEIEHKECWVAAAFATVDEAAAYVERHGRGKEWKRYIKALKAWHAKVPGPGGPYPSKPPDSGWNLKIFRIAVNDKTPPRLP